MYKIYALYKGEGRKIAGKKREQEEKRGERKIKYRNI